MENTFDSYLVLSRRFRKFDARKRSRLMYDKSNKARWWHVVYAAVVMSHIGSDVNDYRIFD